MLVMLCRLYVNVITTIKGYGEFLWVDVVEQIDSMTEQVNGFQAQCKKLPKVSRPALLPPASAWGQNAQGSYLVQASQGSLSFPALMETTSTRLPLFCQAYIQPRVGCQLRAFGNKDI